MELVVQAARPLALALLLLGCLHCCRRALGLIRRGRGDRCDGFEPFGAALVLVRGAWTPAAAVKLCQSPACSLTDQSCYARECCVNGRHLQHEEGHSDGDQRREDRYRCGRGEDLCVCSKHWQLNWNQLAAEPAYGRQSAESWGLATKRSYSQRYVFYPPDAVDATATRRQVLLTT